MTIPVDTIDHFDVIPVRVNDAIETRMILDTGIGLTVLSKELCARARCETSGQYTGRRMSGQSISVPLARVASMTVGTHRAAAVQVGVIDAAALLPPGVDGIVSLGLFEHVPFTVDHVGRTLTIEDLTSLKRRRESGQVVPVRIERDSASVTLFMSMEVPNGPPLELEIDTGSRSLILDERYMSRLGIRRDSPSVKRVEGTDETSHTYVRYFTTIAGSIHPTGAPSLRQTNPKVMFQQIIYDGLVGRGFLESFAVTYDLPGSQIVLGPR